MIKKGWKSMKKDKKEEKRSKKTKQMKKERKKGKKLRMKKTLKIESWAKVIRKILLFTSILFLLICMFCKFTVFKSSLCDGKTACNAKTVLLSKLQNIYPLWQKLRIK